MNGSTWLASLPENPGNERDNKILDAISNGIVVCRWKALQTTHQKHQATFYVCEDAAHVVLDDGSRFRFQVSAKLAQLCADALNASLITSKISDITYQQTKIKLSATTLPAGPDMVSTSKSKFWNTKVEQKRKTAKLAEDDFVRDCGKAWILTNRLGGKPNLAANYGFYDIRAPHANKIGQKMWQTVGTRHDSAHTDYSQTLLLMSQTCEVDGQQMNVADVMQSLELCGLISDEGILKYTRQPGVPFLK